MKKTGLFFGSFNPIHMGHMIIAQVMAETTDMDEVWFVVSPQNPFKEGKHLLHEFDRYDMVSAAVHDNYKFRVTDIEFHMPKPSYTIDTLVYLREKNPEREFSLVIGADNLKHFHKWKNFEVILRDYPLYVYPRPGAKMPDKYMDLPNVHLVDAPMVDISATFIRKCIQNGYSVQYLVPDSVAELIRGRKYYI